jgi:hypothetical protein
MNIQSMLPRISAVLLLGFSIAIAQAQENEFPPLLIKNYKVDSCIIYKLVEGDSVPVKQVVNKVVFNAEGLISDYYTISQYEEDEVKHKVHEYVNGKPVLTTAYGYDIVPIETRFIYKGGVLVQQIISGSDPREYVVFVDNEGRLLERIGKAALPEYDSITGEPTGKVVWNEVEEYLYKYNKYKKITEETFNFYGNESHRSVYDYGPSGNAPMQKKTIYRHGNKTPDTEIIYTYTPNNLIASQQMIFLEDNFSETLHYEYYFAGGNNNQEMKQAPVFTPPPPPKMPKGKGSNVKDYKNPSYQR